MPKNNRKQLSADQLVALPITIGEARKLLGAQGHNMNDDDIAWYILYLSQLAKMAIEARDLQ